MARMAGGVAAIMGLLEPREDLQLAIAVLVRQ